MTKNQEKKSKDGQLTVGKNFEANRPTCNSQKQSHYWQL
jgi:hypothetical protein